jgi:hypothetical protein
MKNSRIQVSLSHAQQVGQHTQKETPRIEYRTATKAARIIPASLRRRDWLVDD